MSTKGNKPQFIARSKRSEDSDYMQTIGAAWNFKVGGGTGRETGSRTNGLGRLVHFGET